MSYIYRIDRDSENSYHRVSAGSFLSVKKVPYISPGQKVAIYAKNEEMEGIFSFVTIKEARTYKTSEIEDNKNQHFLNRNFFQIPIQTGGYSTVPKIDIRYLKHFPSYNSKVFQKPYKPFTLYWAGLLAWEYEYLKYRFSYDFTPSSGPAIFPDRYWKHYIHVLREQSINYFWNNKLPKEKHACESCGENYHHPYFLEIHDTVEINFEQDFKPVSIHDFVVLCPSCHKKEHLKINKLPRGLQ